MYLTPFGITMLLRFAQPRNVPHSILFNVEGIRMLFIALHANANPSYSYPLMIIFSPSLFKPSFSCTDVSCLHSLNALAQIYYTFLGKTSVLSPLSLKHSIPIISSIFGNSTFFNFMQPLNALDQIFFNVDGSLIFSSILLSKTPHISSVLLSYSFVPNCSSPSFSTAFFRFVHSQNALCWIVLIDDGIIILSSPLMRNAL